MQDRRGIPRWQIRQKVPVRLKDSGLWDDCCLEDMNLKGMCISLPQQLPQEAGVLRINIGLKSDFNLDVEARLCWEREVNGRYLYGMSFSKIMDEDKEEIYQYLSNHCLEQFKGRWWQDR